MSKFQLIIDVDLDTQDLSADAWHFHDQVRNRLFGEGVFGPETEVESYSLGLRVDEVKIKMGEFWIVKGQVTCTDAHPTANIGDVEWQFSDGPAGERGSSADYLSLEEGLKYHSGAILHWDEGNDDIRAYGKHDIRSLADDQYPQVTFGFNEVDQAELDPTDKQCEAVFRKWKQDDQGLTWAEFAKTVQPTFHMNDAITVKWSGMWLAIETDGYTHS